MSGVVMYGLTYSGLDMVQSHAPGQAPLRQEAQLRDGDLVDLRRKRAFVSVCLRE
jgi:hypothetical protein